MYVFSPTFLLNFRYGLTAQEFPERRVSSGFDLGSLGFSSGLTSLVDSNIATIPNVKRIMSTVTEGGSATTVEFTLDADLATALDDTRDAVTRIRTDLPQDIQEPMVGKVDIGGSLLTYAVSAPRMSADELSWFVDLNVMREISGVRLGSGRQGSFGLKCR